MFCHSCLAVIDRVKVESCLSLYLLYLSLLKHCIIMMERVYLRGYVDYLPRYLDKSYS
jgi:hypothetical protein